MEEMQLNCIIYTVFILIVENKRLFQVSYEVSNKFSLFLRCIFFKVTPPEFAFLKSEKLFG